MARVEGQNTGKVPKCPNHGEPLQLDKKQQSQTKGASPCPVSGVLFSWTQEATDQVIGHDKFGNPLYAKRWKTDGEERT